MDINSTQCWVQRRFFAPPLQYTLVNTAVPDKVLKAGWGPVTDEGAILVAAQLLLLEAEHPSRDLWLYISSPGGDVTACLGSYDTMMSIRCDVATVALGQAVSSASLLLAAGARGKRHALANARISLGPLAGSLQGVAADIGIAAREVLRMSDDITRLYARHTGHLPATIVRARQRDAFFSAHDAKRFGLVDHVLTRRGATPPISPARAEATAKSIHDCLSQQPRGQRSAEDKDQIFPWTRRQERRLSIPALN